MESLQGAIEYAGSIEGTVEAAITATGAMTEFILMLELVFGQIGRPHPQNAGLLHGELIASLTAALKSSQALVGCLQTFADS